MPKIDNIEETPNPNAVKFVLKEPVTNGAANDLEERCTRSRDLDLKGLRQKLLVVRELPVDAAGRQPDVFRREDHLVFVYAQLDAFAGLCDARQLTECACGNDRLELRHLAAQLGFFHRQPIRVRRGHDELAGLEAHEDPGQHRA